MKTGQTLRLCRFRSVLAATVLAMAWSTAGAAPGAHGPGGEHLDSPAGQSGAAMGALPRMEAASDEFELVALLGGGALSILIDRFASNEPVLGARVQVEVGMLKANAAFRADHGDYSVDDTTMLKKLGEPGEHALVVTVLAGAESDLLDGTLVVANPSPTGTDGHGHGEGDAAHGHALERAGWLAAGTVLLGTMVALIWRRRRRRRGASPAGGV